MHLLLQPALWGADGQHRPQVSLRKKPACAKLPNTHTQTKRKCFTLTYLLSFFSGGDFLSQPWKMISPPLMFVAVCFFFFFLYKLPSVTSTWRLLQARLLTVLSAFGSQWCSLLPPFDYNNNNNKKKIKVVLVAPGGAAPNKPACAKQTSATRLSGWKLRTTSWQGAAGKLNWCRVRKCCRVSAICFPNSYHAHRAERGMGRAGMNRMGELLLLLTAEQLQ